MSLINLLKILIFITSLIIPKILSSQPIAANLSVQDNTDLHRIEAYLNDIKAMRANFLQVSSNGEVSTGVLLMLRPGKIRFEYDPPNPILLIADGVYLRYIDKDLEQVTHLWQENTPISVLVKENIRLSGDITVTKLSRGANTLSASLINSKYPDNGSIKIIFSDNPLSLKKWVIIDPQGIKTTITLNKKERSISIDPSLFEFNGLDKIQ
jgi:outer membrane lipoprotein-sorting protein